MSSADKGKQRADPPEQGGASQEGGAKQKPKRVRAACNECHRLKTKCDGQNPCGRCTRTGRICTYAQVPPPPQQGSRTKTACEGCKMRKLKCDGRNPCAACVKSNWQCIYTGAQPQPQQDDGQPGSSTQTGEQSGQQQRPNHGGACMKCIENNIPCSGEQPCNSCFAMHEQCIYSQQPEPSRKRDQPQEQGWEEGRQIPKPAQQPRPNQNLTCLNCIQMHVICSGNQPCESCVGVQEPCIYPQQPPNGPPAGGSAGPVIREAVQETSDDEYYSQTDAEDETGHEHCDSDEHHGHHGFHVGNRDGDEYCEYNCQQGHQHEVDHEAWNNHYNYTYEEDVHHDEHYEDEDGDQCMHDANHHSEYEYEEDAGHQLGNGGDWEHERYDDGDGNRGEEEHYHDDRYHGSHEQHENDERYHGSHEQRENEHGHEYQDDNYGCHENIEKEEDEHHWHRDYDEDDHRRHDLYETEVYGGDDEH